MTDLLPKSEEFLLILDPIQGLVLRRGRVDEIKIRGSKELFQWDEFLKQNRLVANHVTRLWLMNEGKGKSHVQPCLLVVASCNNHSWSLTVANDDAGWVLSASDTARVVSVLQHVPKLKELHLRWNSYRRPIVEEISKALQHVPPLEFLTTLDLTGSRIRCRGAEHLSKALQRVPNLTELCLKNNIIGDEGVKHIAKGFQRVPYLTTLGLEKNNISAIGAQHLSNGLRHIRHLTVLNLGYNDIGLFGGLEHIANQGFQHVPLLETLTINNNSIDADGAFHLANGLQHIPHLTELCLKNNIIGDIGLEYVAKGLQHIPNLMTLDLESNNIGDIGAGHISIGIQHLCCLRVLKLACNRIGPFGAVHIANGLEFYSYYLKVLTIDNNLIKTGDFLYDDEDDDDDDDLSNGDY